MYQLVQSPQRVRQRANLLVAQKLPLGQRTVVYKGSLVLRHMGQKERTLLNSTRVKLWVSPLKPVSKCVARQQLLQPVPLPTTKSPQLPLHLLRGSEVEQRSTPANKVVRQPPITEVYRT